MMLACLVFLYPVPQSALQLYYSPTTLSCSTGISASLPRHRIWNAKAEVAGMKSNATIYQQPSRDQDTEEDTYIDEEAEMIKSMLPCSSRQDSFHFNRSQNIKRGVYIYANLVFLR
jgi:hypothetical protein